MNANNKEKKWLGSNNVSRGEIMHLGIKISRLQTHKRSQLYLFVLHGIVNYSLERNPIMLLSTVY